MPIPFSAPAHRKAILLFSFVVCLLVGTYFRGSGLFHGLESDILFHPDEPKQVERLGEFLEGRHVSYHNNRFVDGYPFGLNRVDEAILLGYMAISESLNRWLHGETAEGASLDFETINYLARVLRLVYGLTVLCLCFWLVWKLTSNPWFGLLAMALLAVSPLPSTVTHAATGDIGVNLFFAITLAGMVLYVRNPKWPWLLVASAAVGAGFASKYHGALTGWVVVLTVLFGMTHSVGTWKKLLLVTIPMALSAALAVYVLAPGFAVDAELTLELMFANFTFIKNYGVPQEFVDKPFLEKLAHGLSNNLWPTITHLGMLLFLFSLSALGRSIWEWKRSLNTRAEDRRFWAFGIAVSSFPLFAVVLPVSLKPLVQPFHFSFVCLSLCISAALLVTGVRERPKWLRATAGLLILLSVAELLRVSLQEDFFWRNSDTKAAAFAYADEAPIRELHYRDRGEPRKRTVKEFWVEPSILPVFRNRWVRIEHPDWEWWIANHPLPLPSIPMFEQANWIFLNGVEFPRNDRSRYVKAESKTVLHLVSSDPDSEEILLGFRSGSAPTVVRGKLGQHPFEFHLPPNEQHIQSLPLPHTRTSTDGAVSISTLDLEVSPGDVWLTVLDGKRSFRRYQAFGPRPPEGLALSAPKGLEQRLGSLHFLAGDGPHKIGPVASSLLPQHRSVLPAGAYQFTSWILNPGKEAASVQFQVATPSGTPSWGQHSVTVPPGYHPVEWSFAKSFVPYQFALGLTADHPVELRDWTLVPVFTEPGRDMQAP